MVRCPLPSLTIVLLCIGSNAARLRYNIAYITRGGFSQKIPILVVLIKKFSSADGDATVELIDPTGQIDGCIQRAALESWPAISTGAVLALKKVAVFNPTLHSHYLNITAANITCVFPHNTPLPPNFQKPTIIPLAIYYSDVCLPADDHPTPPLHAPTLLPPPSSQQTDDVESLLADEDEKSVFQQYNELE